MNLIVKDPLQRRIEIANWIILAIIFIPSLIFSPFKFSLGVLLGGFISILNFYWMERGLRGFLQKLAGNVKGPVMVKYYIRLALTAVVLYFLIANRHSKCHWIAYRTFRCCNQYIITINYHPGKKKLS